MIVAGRLAMVAGYLAAATLLQLARQTGARAAATIWAEDGSVFWTDRLADGAVAPIFRTYAGYAHLVPRLLAMPGGAIPPSHYAVVTAATAAAFVGLLGLHAYVATGWLLHHRWRRMVVAGAFLLLPAARFEVTATWANLQWPLMASAALVLLDRDLSRARTWANAAVAFVAVPTAPLAILLVPLAVARAITDRTRPTRIVLAAFLAGALLQTVAVAAAPAADRVWEFGARPFWLFVPRVVGRLVFGEWAFDRLAETAPALLIASSAAIASAACAWRLVRDRSRVATPAALVGVALAFWVVPLMTRGTTLFTWDNRYSHRYAVPSMLLLVVAALVPSVGSRPRRRVGVAACLAVVWVGLAVVPSYRGENPRSPGPTWATELAAARLSCRDGGAVADVGVSPAPATKTFVLRIPCGRLRAG